MTQEFVEVQLEDTGAKGTVPARTLEKWKERGWKPVENTEPDAAAAVEEDAPVELAELAEAQGVDAGAPELTETADETAADLPDAPPAPDEPAEAVEAATEPASADEATATSSEKTRTSRGARSR